MKNGMAVLISLAADVMAGNVYFLYAHFKRVNGVSLTWCKHEILTVLLFYFDCFPALSG